MFYDKIRTIDLERVYERVTFENTGVAVDSVFVGVLVCVVPPSPPPRARTSM